MAKRSRRQRHSRLSYAIELDLHGYQVDDAIRELENVMYRQADTSILVIHGRGEGRLRDGVRRFLDSNAYVKHVCRGEDLNLPGGDGVTVVYV